MAMVQKVNKSRYGEPNLRINDEEQASHAFEFVINNRPPEFPHSTINVRLAARHRRSR